MEQSSNKSRAFLSKLDDHQLRQILLAEVESDDTDVDLIRNITAVLESRDHAGTEIDAQKAYRFFVEEHAEEMPLYDEIMTPDASTKRSKPVRISRLARIGIVAAIILSFVIVTTGIASAAGIDIWGAFTKWTEKTFGVIIGDKENVSEYSSPNDACHEVRQILENCGMVENVVPYCLPEGYLIIDFSSEATYEGTVVTAIYGRGTDEIVFFYAVGGQDSSILCPKDEEEPLVYECAGIPHYLFGNEKEWTAIWQNNNISCQISGVSSKAELIRIIDSIYERK